MEYLWEHLLLCVPMADNGSGGLAGQLQRGGEPFACHDHQQQLFRNIFVQHEELLGVRCDGGIYLWAICKQQGPYLRCCGG